ncbi:hypothetical protein CPC08DRAFT_702608 [Agrocybe pediades]|nr:hypothetical protein CPC08DRAFT_702608 [Agrocybe pediades]
MDSLEEDKTPLLEGMGYHAIEMDDQPTNPTTRLKTPPTIPQFQTLVYKLHDAGIQTDPTLIRVPIELFEGPAQDCLELFLQDWRKEYPETDIVNPRQLELWAPKEPLPIEVAMTKNWQWSGVTDRHFNKIIRSIPLFNQISVSNESMVHLFVSARAPGQKKTTDKQYVIFFLLITCTPALVFIVLPQLLGKRT